MIRKKQKMTNSTIMKKLGDLESDHLISETPFLAFMGKLPDGRWEVSEHIKAGKGMKYRDLIVDAQDNYFATNPTWIVIIDDFPMVDMLKKMISDEEYGDKLLDKANERLIER